MPIGDRPKKGSIAESSACGGIQERGEGNLAVLGGFLILAQIWVFSVLGWLARLLAGAIQPKPPTVLVVGGNGFIGSYTTSHLVSQGYHVVMTNRNSTYFDNYQRLANVETLYWDRRQLGLLDEPSEVKRFLDFNPNLLAVVDFSCFDGVQAAELLNFLRPYSLRYYVYISTDSIYEVCTKDHTGPTLETDDKRPTDLMRRTQLNLADTYGDKKLEAEETIRQLWNNDTMTYAFVRIPDVVGPRDTTYRFWMYQLLIKLQSRIDVPIPYVEEDEQGREMSLVYAGDIAKAVRWLISSEYNTNKIQNEPVNIAQKEKLPFKTIMETIATQLQVDNQTLRYDLNATTDFPSVKKGPISTKLAETVTEEKWDSTPWLDVVKETVAYNEKAMTDPALSKERAAVLRMVHQQVVKYGKVEEMKVALQELYGFNNTSLIDSFPVPTETAGGGGAADAPVAMAGEGTEGQVAPAQKEEL